MVETYPLSLALFDFVPAAFFGIGASFIVRIAVISKGMDYYRLAREFFIATSQDERMGFIKALFAFASRHDGVSNHETEEIRSISKLLKLTHKQFIEVKMR